MKALIIYGDREILNEKSDVFFRHNDYSNCLDELHAHVLTEKCEQDKIIGNIHVHPFPRKNPIKLFFYLRKIILREKVDLIIAPRPFVPGVLAVILKIVTKRKLLMSVFGANIFRREWYLCSIKNFIYRFTIGPIVFYFSDYFQTDSVEDFEFLKNKFISKKVFWKPLVPQNISDFFYNRDISNKNITTILFIGRLVAQKNIKLLAKIINESLSTISNIKFNIIGEGSYGYLIKELAIKFPEFVSWSNPKTREEIIAEYTKSDILLLCSKFEGFPRVFMEAASSAIPIITSNVCGKENLIKDSETGFIIKNENCLEYVSKIRYLSEHKSVASKMGLALRDVFNNNFNYNLTIKLQKEIFEYIKGNI